MMTAEPGRIAAVHYIYLLKEDEKDLRLIWPRLTQGVAGVTLQPPSLDLLSGEAAGHCEILHRAEGAGVDYCLMALANLIAIQLIYRRKEQAAVWPEVLESLETDRNRALAGEITVIGEATLLVTGETGVENMAEAARRAGFDGKMLLSDLDPSFTRNTGSRLCHFPEYGGRNRSYWILAADKPEPVLSGPFPETDSMILQLGRLASHFGHQRRSIIENRAAVDKEVGGLLHQQVVAGAGKAEASQLEERIGSLSRMFGILATDSLIVRQAEDRLERDLAVLEKLFALLFGAYAGAQNEIGEYYTAIYRRDLDAARDEIRNLNFSRRNTQAAIEVVRTHVELLRAGEEAAIQEQTRELLSRSLVLQKERLALQVAAGFVEFVLVFYYLLKSWEGIAGVELVEHISPLVRLLVIGGTSAGAALGTHFLAQTLQSRSWKNTGLWVSVVLLVLSFAAMVMLTVINS